MTEDAKGLRERLSTQGEQALGKLAQDLLDNPLVSSALTRAFDARERAVQAQEAAMGALNIPSAADIERLENGSDDQLAAKLDALTEEVRKLGAADPKPKPKPKPSPQHG
jgi:hypothetical protein